MGIDLKQIGVGLLYRRQGIATRLINYLQYKVNNSKYLSYVLVESVITDEMMNLMDNREDFTRCRFANHNYYWLK